MKAVPVLLALALGTVAVAGPALAAPADKPTYYKIEEEKFLGLGTGKYSYNGEPLKLTEKPWWYGWTPDTKFNSGVSSDRFKAVLAAHPEALATAQGRDFVRTIGMVANIGSRGVALATGMGLIGMGQAQAGLASAFLLVGSGILVDFGTELLTLGSLERSVWQYNEHLAKGATLRDWRAAGPQADVQVGLFQATF